MCSGAICFMGRNPGEKSLSAGSARTEQVSSQYRSRLQSLMLRLGLCCIFSEQPIKFGTTTAAAMSRLSPEDARARLAALCLKNADSLMEALRFCAASGIGSFRINSQILPLKTHPAFRYEVGDLPAGADILRRFEECGDFVRQQGLRTTFHPDQFVVLNSLRPEVVASSLAEIEYQAEVAEWVGADVVNIHGGGAFGDKPQSLGRFAQALDQLSDRARSRLTVENDDKIYTPNDLLPICRATGIPLVYDVHHHRCHGDGLSIKEATDLALTTWNREPLFHLSSPRDGWDQPHPERHHDEIDPADFPRAWANLTATVEVEAKAKEQAVLKFRDFLITRARAKVWARA
jgi:UV DNA damage endonuclease